MTSEHKAFSDRDNARRAARRELGRGAILGIDFALIPVKTIDGRSGWRWWRPIITHGVSGEAGHERIV